MTRENDSQFRASTNTSLQEKDLSAGGKRRTRNESVITISLDARRESSTPEDIARDVAKQIGIRLPNDGPVSHAIVELDDEPDPKKTSTRYKNRTGGVFVGLVSTLAAFVEAYMLKAGFLLTEPFILCIVVTILGFVWTIRLLRG